MTNVTENVSAYDQNSIQVLEGLEAVRMRPGMYIGDTGKRGLHHTLWEVVDNSVDETMAGFCTLIHITIAADGETATVEDNGRGIPTAIHPKTGKSTVETVLTILHAGGKFGGESYGGGSGGLHGVGVSCVNALSDKLKVIVWREGNTYEQHYERGKPLDVLAVVSASRKRGTSITYHPDPLMFPAGVEFDEELIIRRLRQTAFLNAGLKIIFTNQKTGRVEEFYANDGLKSFVAHLTKNKTGHYPENPFFVEAQQDKTKVQVSFQYTQEDDETILTFANNIETCDGGTHLSGFKTALTRVVNQFAKSTGSLKAGDNNLSGDDIREGLTAVIAIRQPSLQFEGQTKSKLGSVEIEGIVNSLAGEALTEYFEKNPGVVRSIVERALVAQRARDAAKRQSELIKRKGFLGKGNRLPGKLKDCDSENREETELFLVEGDSASGSAKDGRNARTQAILALRGKILNAEKSDLESLLKNNEVQALITAIGTGILDDFDLEKRRYNKIVIMTDADVDGSHISTLLLTLFWRFMRPLVMNGHVYLAQPPLFRVDVSKKSTYAWSIPEMQKLVESSSGKAKTVRFKGLGEMNPEELAATTMNIETRRLARVTVPDIIQASELLGVLMGKSVSARKAHIVDASQKRDRI